MKQKKYNIDLKSKDQLPEADAVVFAVAHKDYVQNKRYINLVKRKWHCFDIKGVIDDNDVSSKQGLWRL